jgi:hypothetical protein
LDNIFNPKNSIFRKKINFAYTGSCVGSLETCVGCTCF